jgi:NADH dehydrogenase
MRQFLTTEDARGLRLAAARAVEEAARIEQDGREVDQAELQRRLTVLIVGAGPTGVEVAGELAELMTGLWETQRRVAGDPPDYRLPRPRIILADAASTILPGWSEATIQAATAALRELGVEVRLHAAAAGAEPGRVTFKDGAVIAAGVLVWAGGVRAPKLLAETGLPTGSGGRVQVDRFQRVPGREEIFVVGDSALVADESTGRPLPPTADLALREGETAALALAATLQGHDPSRVLRPQTRNAVSVGQERGAATLFGTAIKGRAAHAIKDLIEWEYRESITHWDGISAATVV